MALIKFDELTVLLGQFGKYQRLIFFLICLVKLPTAFNNMGIVFIAGTPEHWCRTPELDHFNLTLEQIENLTIPVMMKDGRQTYSSCQRFVLNYSQWTAEDVDFHLERNINSITEKCNHGWVYDKSVYLSTAVSQWDLVCDRRWLHAAASSVYMAGLACGVFIISSAADIIGRRKALMITLPIAVLTPIAMSFSPNFATFCVLRFITGFGCMGIANCVYVLVVELVGPAYRMHVGIAVFYYWAGGYLAYALIAYFLRDWFILNMTASCILLPLLLFLFIAPESARWLYVHGRKDEADKIIQKAARINKVCLPEDLIVEVKNEKKGFVWDLFRTPRMSLRSFNICWNWFVNSAVYYGLSLNTSNLGGDAFINFSLAAAMEIPAYILCQLSLHYLGRKWPLCVSMVIGGVALLCTMAVPIGKTWLIITMNMIGKFGITCSFGIIYVLTVELYPTTVRTVAVGTGSLFARIGGVIAPFIGQLSDISMLLPMIIFGLMSVSAGLLILMLPETRGRSLPETLQDGENFGRKLKQVENGTDDNVNPAFSTEKL